MTAPSDKQKAILNKYHKTIPATIQEASQIISGLFGKKEETHLQSNDGKQETNNFKLACDTIAKYAETCKQLGYPIEYWNLSTVWNTAIMHK